jgi:tetratricopeptide (TPR) repeat protein
MRRSGVLVSAGLVALALAAYGRLWRNDFIDLDDGLYITGNSHVLDGLTGPDVRWAWITCHAGFWFPLTWMSLQLDATLSPGRGPGGLPVVSAAVFHGQNLFWHAATTVLLFLTLGRLTGSPWQSAMVAALFAIHPLHVESVAWATERKDVLSTFFLVLTLFTYSVYASRPSPRRYLLVLAMFVLGLLSKPMLVTLPFLLLLLDYWPLGRWGGWGNKSGEWRVASGERKGAGAKNLGVSGNRGSHSTHQAPLVSGQPSFATVLLEKLPLLAIAAGAAILTILTQRTTDALRPLHELPFSARLANALLSYGWYVGKTCWPTQLSVLYTHPGTQWHWVPVVVGGTVLALFTLVSLLAARRWPWLAVGWLWFVGTLVPVIGLVQSGDQARADRFVYVPHIGLFVALVWGAAALLDRLRVSRTARVGLATSALAGLAAMTWVQVGYWQNPLTLWSHALAVAPDNHRAHFNLGNYSCTRAWKRGDAALLARSREHYDQALALHPDCRYHCGLGVLLLYGEDFVAAKEQFAQGLSLNPNSADAWIMLGVARLRADQAVPAEQALRHALELEPGAAARGPLGTVLWQQGRQAEAEDLWRQALRANPDDIEARVGVARVLLRQGRNREAARDLAAIAASPEQLSLLGVALSRMGEWSYAVAACERAVQVREVQARLLTHPDQKALAMYRRQLAYALQGAGRSAEASREYAAALALDPNWPAAAGQRAWQLATDPDPAFRDPPEALEMASQACQALPEPPAGILDSLAAALAAAGNYNQAAATARRALAAATPPLANDIARRLHLYEQGKPFISHASQSP